MTETLERKLNSEEVKDFIYQLGELCDRIDDNDLNLEHEDVRECVNEIHHDIVDELNQDLNPCDDEWVEKDEIYIHQVYSFKDREDALSFSWLTGSAGKIAYNAGLDRYIAVRCIESEPFLYHKSIDLTNYDSCVSGYRAIKGWLI